MSANAKFAVKRKGGLHDYYEELYTNPEQPNECTGNDAKTIEVKDAAEIRSAFFSSKFIFLSYFFKNIYIHTPQRSVSGVFEFLGEEDVAFEYQRIPISKGAHTTNQQTTSKIKNTNNNNKQLR